MGIMICLANSLYIFVFHLFHYGGHMDQAPSIIHCPQTPLHTFIYILKMLLIRIMQEAFFMLILLSPWLITDC